MTVHEFGSHSMECWTVHEECALRSAISYVSARVEHDRGRLRMYRLALNDPKKLDEESRILAVALARDLMAQNSRTDWKRVDTA